MRPRVTETGRELLRARANSWLRRPVTEAELAELVAQAESSAERVLTPVAELRRHATSSRRVEYVQVDREHMEGME